MILVQMTMNYMDFMPGRSALAVGDLRTAISSLFRAARDCPTLKLHALDAVCYQFQILVPQPTSIFLFLFVYMQMVGAWKPQLEANPQSGILHLWASYTFDNINQVKISTPFFLITFDLIDSSA